MSIHSTKLKLRATGRMISAELHDDLAVESLFEAEKVWGPERTEFLRECIKAGVKDLPQSIHWNWPTKAATRFPGLKTNALTGYRLFGIKAENNWQGLLLAVCVGYQSRIPPGEKDIVYVEFVETAPWN